MTPLAMILAGAIASAEAVIGIFFLRFWTRSGDGLFLAFALAFWLMAINQTLVALFGAGVESSAPFYLLRLAAYVLIIFAIVRKNTRRKGPMNRSP